MIYSIFSPQNFKLDNDWWWVMMTLVMTFVSLPTWSRFNNWMQIFLNAFHCWLVDDKYIYIFIIRFVGISVNAQWAYKANWIVWAESGTSTRAHKDSRRIARVSDARAKAVIEYAARSLNMPADVTHLWRHSIQISRRYFVFSITRPQRPCACRRQ